MRHTSIINDRLLHKAKVLGLILFSYLGYALPAHAAPLATISSLVPPVWTTQNGTRTPLDQRSKLKTGDPVITGDKGQIEIKLRESATVQLNSNSEVIILTENTPESPAPEEKAVLQVVNGRACINFNSVSDSMTQFKLNLAGKLFAVIHQQGNICVYRDDSSSSIKLISGSIQVTHAIEPNTVIMGRAGSEYRVDDDGSFNLSQPGMDEALTPAIEMPFRAQKRSAHAEQPGAEIAVPQQQSADANKTDTKTSKFSPQNETSDYEYSVYLFSTQSQDKANEVNQNLRNAGYDTLIYTHEKNAVTYYRIAKKGFNSLQSAKQFSQAIVGSLGILDSWIGKDKQE